MSLLAVLAAAGSDPPAPPTEAWRNIAYAPRITPRIVGTVADTKTSTVTFKLARDVTDLTLTFMCARGNAPVVRVGNDVTYAATVDGTPVTFAGQTSGVCLDGDILTSDPLPVGKASGATITVVTTATAPTGGKVPINSDDAVAPYRVNGMTDQPSVLVLGSSSGVPRFFTAGMDAGGVPVVNGSIGGARAGTFTNEVLGDFMGLRQDHGFTHAFLQVGINSNGQGVAAMCQAGLNLALRLRSYGIGHVAAMVWKPHTNSTDGWTTVENQTPKFTDRAAAVAWLRRGAPVKPDGKTYDLMGTTAGAIYAGQAGHPFSTVVDWGQELQAASNPDVFRVDHGVISTDGLHINETGYSLAAHVLTAWAASL